jgi:hypothetical protein
MRVECVLSIPCSCLCSKNGGATRRRRFPKIDDPFHGAAKYPRQMAYCVSWMTDVIKPMA